VNNSKSSNERSAARHMGHAASIKSSSEIGKRNYMTSRQNNIRQQH